MSSTILKRDALSCSRSDVSTVIAVHDGRPTVTFLDRDGHEFGSWWPIQGTVLWHTMDGDAPMGDLAQTADEACEILRPAVTPDDLVFLPERQTCLGLTKAQDACKRLPMTSAGANVHFCAAHQAQAPKTPSVAPATKVRTTRKESTMTPTQSNTQAIAQLQADAIETKAALGSLESKLDTLIAHLAPTTAAKAPVTRKAPAPKAAPKPAKARKAPKVKGPGAKVNRATTPASSAKTKGARPVAQGQGLSRSAWNKTLSAKARLAGSRNGVSVYSLVIKAWKSDVEPARVAGQTPDEVLARFTK